MFKPRSLQFLICFSWSLVSCLAYPKPPSPKFEVRLISGPTASGGSDDFELSESRRALLRLKDNLGVQGLLNLLGPDIEFANAKWKTILENSTGGHILAEARLEATLLDAKSFLAWFDADTGDKHKMTGANPEHFIEQPLVVNGILTGFDIVENWGDLVVHYTIPSYGNNPKKPWMKKLPDWPYQAVGDAVLLDGKVIGNIHNSFRDKVDGTGIEADLCVWLPDSTPEGVVEGLRQHQAVEFTNWLKFAHRDITSGTFRVPGSL